MILIETVSETNAKKVNCIELEVAADELQTAQAGLDLWPTRVLVVLQLKNEPVSFCCVNCT